MTRPLKWFLLPFALVPILSFPLWPALIVTAIYVILCLTIEPIVREIEL